MSETNPSLVLRWARWQMRVLARVWPEESRDWGEAIASEAEEIAQPAEALGWALGGVTVYLRALGAHFWEWLKMPVGQRGEAARLAGAPGPKRSRLFAVVVLTCSAGLLCLPEGREAIRTVRATWENYAEVDPSQEESELAAQGQKENDAQLMAFAALSLEDEKRALELADSAVNLNPQLFWIYQAKSSWPDNSAGVQDWLAKARSTDPKNAGPYLRAADVVAHKILSGLVRQHSPTETETTQAVTGSAEWRTLMDQAFRAPTYNSYYREHEELSRELWRRRPQLLLAMVLPSLWQHAIPNMLSMKQYTKLLVREAEDERAAGHLARAQELLSEATAFGKRVEADTMRNGRFEGLGLSLERESALGWQGFYEATGDTAKAHDEAEQVAQPDRRGAADVREAIRLWQQRSRMEGSAWAVEISALLIVAAVLVAGLGIALFEIWPAIGKRSTATRQVLSYVTDFAPAAVLLASAAFVLSFLPYAGAMAAFRGGSGGRSDVLQLSTAFWSLDGAARSLAGPSTEVLGWTLLTVVLSVAAALILARMAYRGMRKTAPQA